MSIGDVRVMGNYPPKGGLTVTNLTSALAALPFAPNQIIVINASSYNTPGQVSGIYLITSAGGNKIAGMSLSSGTDGPWSPGDIVQFQASLTSSGGGGGNGGNGVVNGIVAGAGIAVANNGTAVPTVSIAPGSNNALLGFTGSGSPSDITVSTGLNLASSILTATGIQSLTGDVTASNNGVTTVVNAGGVAIGLLATQNAITGSQMPALSGAIISNAASAVTAFNTITSNTVLANITGNAAAPTGTTASLVLDTVGNTTNGIPVRGASVWGISTALIVPTVIPRVAAGSFLNMITPGNAVFNSASAVSLFSGATFRSGQSLTIPGNTLAAGDLMRFRFGGLFSCSASTPNLNFTLSLGGTNVAQGFATGNFAFATTNGPWQTVSTVDVSVQSISGNNASVFLLGNFVYFYPTNSNTQLGSLTMINGIAGAPNGLPTVVNYVGNLALDLKVAWFAANNANSIQLTNFAGEFLG